jgi:tRNA threonylcarbamoyl adenosine modification protein YjeE
MNLSEAELARWGGVIGAEVHVPMFVLLRGPLGAGKSVLARAIARGAGVEGAMPSPTFNILFRYPTSRGFQVVHLDLYRVSEPEELWELGWQELGAPDELVLVEWPERAEEHLPRDRWEVTLAHVDGDPDSRTVEVNRVGRPPHLPGFPVSLSA